MTVSILEQELKHIFLSNDWFMMVLRAARECNPLDWLIGGGVIRNIVWDYLHGYKEPTPLKDIDVAFFDLTDMRREREKEIERDLTAIMPNVIWEANNQAAVHLWYEKVFGYPVEPLVSSEDAIGTWPEPATCVAVRLLPNDDLFVVAPHGLEDLFNIELRHNPRRVTYEIFMNRLIEKKIEQKWPKVKIIL